MKSREEIEQLSNLIQACNRCGATFCTGLETYIEMPDKTKIPVLIGDHWNLVVCISTWHHIKQIDKNQTIAEIQISILEFYVKILKLLSGQAV